MVESAKNACAICHEAIPAESSAARPITGNVCSKCVNSFGAPQGVPLRDFLDRLDVPVIVADGDAVVSAANKPLLAMLGKSLGQIAGQRGGDVFECAYAHLPGGCGHTVHCSGCAIRMAVTETFTTGRSLRNVPAYLNRDMPTQFLQLSLAISTEKAWGMVLLRIDHIGPRPEPGRESQGH